MIEPYFNFLKEHGFSAVATSSQNPIRYENATHYIEIWMGNGDRDVLIGSRSDGSFKTLQQIIRMHKHGPFPLLKDFPKKTAMSEDEHFLSYAAHWIQIHLQAT